MVTRRMLLGRVGTTAMGSHSWPVPIEPPPDELPVIEIHSLRRHSMPRCGRLPADVANDFFETRALGVEFPLNLPGRRSEVAGDRRQFEDT